MTMREHFWMAARDREACRYLTRVDEWDALTLIAAVSADPRSFTELGLSWLRYRPAQLLEELPWRDRGQIPANPDGLPWIVMDMARQELASNDEAAIPVERSAYQRDEDEWTPEMPVVWYNLPPWWQRVIRSESTPTLPPCPQAPREPVDFRGVLYGRAMAEDFAQRMQAMARKSLPREYLGGNDVPYAAPRDDPRKVVARRWHEATKRVHADWLMTPRDDLDGEPPRVFLHRGRAWVESEIENRQRQWCNLRQPPRPLDMQTYAYAHSPMGRDEVVVYFELCRAVLAAGWKALCQQPRLCESPREWADGMYAFANDWLQNGSIEGESHSPIAIIECSRRHMPMLASGTHLDCDCPLCRMVADESDRFGPAFSGFDGHHLELEDEFAFSLCETREEWELEQAEYADASERWEYAADRADRNEADPDGEIDERRRGPAQDERDEPNPIWQRSYVVSEDAEESTSAPVSVMTLAFRLTEVIGDLKDLDASREHIEGLNQAFDGLRRAGSTTRHRYLAASPLRDRLELAAQQFAPVVSKSADLQSLLDRWVRRPAGQTELPF
jgi:hypothetical protein